MLRFQPVNEKFNIGEDLLPKMQPDKTQTLEKELVNVELNPFSVSFKNTKTSRSLVTTLD